MTLDTLTKPFYVFYASQSGKAQGFAERIAAESLEHGLKPKLFCLSLIDRKFSIEQVNLAVFVVSTFHNGAPPDKAAKFFKRISNKMLPKNHFEKLNCAILALGDSTHPLFCQFGKNLEERLKALSANFFYPTAYGDDSKGLENTTEPWIEGLWPVLCKHLSLNVNKTPIRSPDLNCATEKPVITSQSGMEALPESFTISDIHLLLKECDIEKLHCPRISSSRLLLSYGEKSKRKQFDLSICTLPFKSSPLTKARLISAKTLTSGGDVKDTNELTFCFEDNQISYVPGDSFGVICKNSSDEVDLLLKRLNVAGNAELPINLEVPENSKKKLPAHIQQNLSLKDVFLNCIEIRAVPKKALLRNLVEFTSDEKEKSALLYLSSQEGASAYIKCVCKTSLSVLDILMHYESCMPPIEILLEHLPSLKPRFYSVASSPLENEESFKIVFNVLKFPASDARKTEREGVCTGLLKRMSERLTASENVSDLSLRLSELKIDSSQLCLDVYKRQNHHFVLPDTLSCPIIMVGPGTGIAPFVGFLQHREKLVKQTPDVCIGNTWLFYGCRYYDKDFLYKSELERLKSAGVLTHLLVSLSRDSSPPSSVTTKYVHESIKQHAQEIVATIKCGVRIYVCGDAKNMAVDVHQAFIDAFKLIGISDSEAKSIVKSLQSEFKYINDVWA